MFKKFTKKAVHAVTEAAKEELAENIDEKTFTYLPVIAGALAVGIGLYFGRKPAAPQQIPPAITVAVHLHNIERRK